MPGWRYRRSTPDLHVLFGYLQVGEVLALGPDSAALRAGRPELAEHPHFNGRWAEGNTVYVASDRLVIDGQDLGVPRWRRLPALPPQSSAHQARQHPDRLVIAGLVPTESRAGAELPHGRRTLGVGGDRCQLRTVAKGQEFVATGLPLYSAAGWLRDIFDL
ncbi:hypothetical protein [Azospirillum sp. HJ39]|uniref:Nmad3 family putative nucleotide modification protein n=1 Tax=Azospirillum sp. HJ39 TaxID=3159496 RepID=UPI0035572E2B